MATQAQHRLTEVVLATDLRRGSSGTYGHSAAQEASCLPPPCNLALALALKPKPKPNPNPNPNPNPKQAALSALEAAVPALRATRRRWLLDGIPDTGVRASVETAICTQARGSYCAHLGHYGVLALAPALTLTLTLALTLAGHDGAHHDLRLPRLQPRRALLQDVVRLWQVHPAPEDGLPPPHRAALLAACVCIESPTCEVVPPFLPQT